MYLEFSRSTNLRFTSNLAWSLELKIDGKFILACNIDLESCLINLQIGALKYFTLNKKQVPVTYVKLEESREGIKTLSSFTLGRSEVILASKRKVRKWYQ